MRPLTNVCFNLRDGVRLKSVPYGKQKGWSLTFWIRETVGTLRTQPPTLIAPEVVSSLSPDASQPWKVLILLAWWNKCTYTVSTIYQHHLNMRTTVINKQTSLYLVTPPKTIAPTTSPLQPINHRPTVRFVAKLGTVAATRAEEAPASTVMVLWPLFTSHCRGCGLRWYCTFKKRKIVTLLNEQQPNESFNKVFFQPWAKA